MLNRFRQFFRGDRPEERDAAPPAEENHVDQLLMDLVEKSYERENEESEAIWRTLPLFPVSFGFAVALIGYAFVAAPSRIDNVLSWVIFGMIGLTTLVFLPAFRWLWRMVNLRRYRYLPNDVEILKYANGLRDFHRTLAEDEADVDQRVAKDLKAYLLTQLAEASSHNQHHNQYRSKARGRTAFYLMACIGLALATNALILVVDKIAVVQKGL